MKKVSKVRTVGLAGKGKGAARILLREVIKFLSPEIRTGSYVVATEVPLQMAFVSLRFETFRASVNDAIPHENTKVGGPQFVGSWLVPVSPASPETLNRFSKNGLTWLRKRLKL